MRSPVIIEISQLSHTYPGTRKTPSIEALKGVSLEIEAGESLALLGPNGSGKSTLLRVLMTALRPTSGRIAIDGFDPGEEPLQVRRLLGVVFQRPALDGRLTVMENLRASGSFYGLKRREIAERGRELLGLLGLAERVEERVDKLSGGLARRVELAKALLHRPRVLLMDEPTTGLDPIARREFWKQVERLREEGGLTVVVSTHLMDEAERCDRVAILHRGDLLACDRPVTLQRNLGSELLTISAEGPDRLLEELKRELGLEGKLIGDTLCIPLIERGGIDLLLKLIGGRLNTLTLSHPSLDDVFASLTGEHLIPAEEGA